MSNRYDIEKISDIFNIPEDRFPDFLVDFESFYRVGLPMVELIKVTAEEVGGIDVSSQIQKFTWIDDGKHDAKIIIKPRFDGLAKKDKPDV